MKTALDSSRCVEHSRILKFEKRTRFDRLTDQNVIKIGQKRPFLGLSSVCSEKSVSWGHFNNSVKNASISKWIFAFGSQWLGPAINFYPPAKFSKKIRKKCRQSEGIFKTCVTFFLGLESKFCIKPKLLEIKFAIFLFLYNF